MRNLYVVLACCAFPVLMSSCASYSNMGDEGSRQEVRPPANYAERLPQSIQTHEKTVLVDPNVHAWGAYSADGNLVHAGLVTAGSNYCPDIGRPCRTGVGTFRINSLGSESCKSTLYPVGRGGAPMPYCMFFNRNQALHGSYEVVEGNISHGCVRMEVSDAEWLRFNFANVGTKVIVRPY